jgi:hypothetical protein
MAQRIQEESDVGIVQILAHEDSEDSLCMSADKLDGSLIWFCLKDETLRFEGSISTRLNA